MSLDPKSSDAPRRQPVVGMSESTATRIWGLAVFVGCIGFEVLLNVFTSRFARIYSFGFFVIGAGLLGLVQAVTGIPVPTLATRWASLRPWQRGVISVAVILAAMCAGVAAIWIAGR